MIELPKIYYNRVCRVEDVEAYGKACAAEAREQMREECVNIVEGSSAITFEVTSELVQAIKELL